MRFVQMRVDVWASEWLGRRVHGACARGSSRLGRLGREGGVRAGPGEEEEERS